MHTLQFKEMILACFCGKSSPLSLHCKNRNLGGLSMGLVEISVNFCRTLSAKRRKNVNCTRPIELYDICQKTYKTFTNKASDSLKKSRKLSRCFGRIKPAKPGRPIEGCKEVPYLPKI